MFMNTMAAISIHDTNVYEPWHKKLDNKTKYNVKYLLFSISLKFHEIYVPSYLFVSELSYLGIGSLSFPFISQLARGS